MRLAGVLLAGCLPRGSATPIEPLGTLRAPGLVALDRACDQDAGEWTVEADADAWSGGIRSWWSVDGVAVEVHDVPVIASDPDGTHDTLRAVFEIVDDWREVQPGRSTVYRCTEPVVTRFVLLDSDGVPSDCATEGDPSVLDGVDGVPDCQ